MTKRILLVLMLLGTLSTGLVIAQPGGGRGNDDRPADRPDRGNNNPPNVNIPNVDPEALFDDWGSLTIPDTLPTNAADLQAALEAAALPLALDVSALPFGASSATAATVIVGFAESYLGVGVTPLYAAESPSPTNPESQAIIAQLPAEIQSLLLQADGTLYYGVLDDGIAAVTSELACDNPNCTVDAQTLQASIDSGSLGAYALYRDVPVSNNSDAYNLITNTFSWLIYYDLEQIETENGYLFVAASIERDSFTGFLVGVQAVGDHSVVYALVGIGEAYVTLMLSS